MAKKLTIRVDDKIAREIDLLSKRTHIPKSRLTAQAYELLLELYEQLREVYNGEIVDINLIEMINKIKDKQGD